MFQEPEEDDQPEIESNRDFNPENLVEKDSMFQEPALSQVGDQAKIAHFNLENLADKSNMFQQSDPSQEDDQPDTESDQDLNLADKDNMPVILSQEGDQPDIKRDQDFKAENPADESNVFQQPAALFQVDGQTDIKSDKDFQAEDESNMFQQPVPIQVDDRKLDIERDQEFSPQTLVDEGKIFQQFATFQVTDTDSNQNFKQETHADESNVFQEPSLSQMDDQQRDMVTDNSNDLTFDETATIQQQSLQDFEDAIKDAQKQVDSNTEIADDIIALLQGEDITKVDSEHAEEQGTSQSMLGSFNSGLQVFVNQMNRMISKYSNVLKCFPSMQAEMQRSDENDDELVKKVVDRLANIQGQQNRQIRQLFQKIRQFIQTTSKEGQKLSKIIWRILGSLLRSYEVVIKCVQRRRG